MDNSKEPIVEQCVGCSKARDGYCSAYLHPAMKWRQGKLSVCPLATHLIKEELTAREKARHFAGKGTDVGAIEGAVGYKISNYTSHTIGKAGKGKRYRTALMQ